MPDQDACILIGFTGTPLLKKDKATTIEVFGRYIHTYKFSGAVEDEVVLDLVYEARDIDQRLGSEEKIDAWFEAKTKGLNDWQREELKRKWGTLQKVLSSRSRMERVVADILLDFSTKTRLSSERGNAMLVAGSIYEACRYFELFRKTPLKEKCAVVTSYNPMAGDVSKEDTGADSETDKQFIFNTYTELLENVTAKPGKSKTETYEDEAKRQEVLMAWYRDQLREAAPPLISRWETLLGVKVKKFFIRHMKTKWGSCNHRDKHILLNSELAKKPRNLLEYVVVHEMVHLLEPTHNERFLTILGKHYPAWRAARAELNELPLAAETWRE